MAQLSRVLYTVLRYAVCREGVAKMINLCIHYQICLPDYNVLASYFYQETENETKICNS